MLPIDYEDTPEMKEIRRIFRVTFTKSDDSRECFRILLHMTGAFSSEPSTGPQGEALRGFGMKLLELVGANHEAREMDLVNAILNVLPFDWEDGKRSVRSDE